MIELLMIWWLQSHGSPEVQVLCFQFGAIMMAQENWN